ncbi:MAG: hypothetical protein JSR39_05090 [Verrucomicrobia bacterium]|nr:hypothetical protein [Verrucomicrobiota bacterium]
MSGISRDAYLAGTGGTHWGSEVVGAAFDKAGEALAELSNSISSVFSSIYKNHLEPLITSYQQGEQSVTDGRSVGPSTSGTSVNQQTVQQHISKVPTSRPILQNPYKLPSVKAYEETIMKLDEKYTEAQRDYDIEYERCDAGHDYESGIDNYPRLKEYGEKAGKLRTELYGFSRQFEADHPVEYNTFQAELKESKAKEETSRSKSMDYSSDVEESSSKEQSSDTRNPSTSSVETDNDVETDPEWW